ncbi:MAG: stage II sporulation protein D [Clostridiales bacterium]|nr:stage II sporulation protein D [Clostridiales bacterium]
MLHRVAALSLALTLSVLLLALTALPEEPLPFPVGTALAADEPDDEGAIDEEIAAEGSEADETASEPVPSDGADGAAETEDALQTETGSPVPETLTVLLPDGTVEEMELEDYLWGVVAAEMPAAFESEALKAQAVAARTYTCYQTAREKSAHPEADVCTDYSCCQAWMSREDRLAAWDEDKEEEYAAKITAAVNATAGEILTWEGEAALTVFHAASADTTRSALDVWGTDLPYLTSVSSPESEADTPNYYSVVSFSAQEFSALFLAAYPDADLSGDCSGWFGAAETDGSGAVLSVSVGGVEVTGSELRTLCSLRSPHFEVECGTDTVTFYVTGYGHGVGMSQYGANTMAAAGSSYQEILAHYYPGTVLEGSAPD